MKFLTDWKSHINASAGCVVAIYAGLKGLITPVEALIWFLAFSCFGCLRIAIKKVQNK